MNPDLLEAYQELTDLIVTYLPDKWQIFRVRAAFDESGLGLRLKFVDNSGSETQISPVEFEVFDVVERIREAAGPELAWTEWIFDYNRSGKYDISVKYPDSPSE